MSDFYALLKQSIIERGITDAKDRAEIYAQARRAVIRQLWDFRPPLAADEIDSRVGVYDTAVERIEADLRQAFANGAGRARRRVAALPAPTPVRLAGAAVARQLREEPDAPPLADFEDDEFQQPRPRQLRPTVPVQPIRRATRNPAPPRQVPQEPYDDYVPPELPNERWQEPRPGGRVGLPPSLTSWLGTGEQRTIRLLATAVGALVILLVGVVSFYIGSRSREDVTIPIGVRQEVSDAATAARIAAESQEVVQNFTIFDGRDPTVFGTTADNPVRFDSSGGFARIGSSASAPGAKVLVGPGLAAQLAGKTVRLVLEARSSTDNGAVNMRFAYQSGVAISHWQTANLDRDFTPVGLIWRLPAMRTNPAGDYIIIEPGIPGDGTGVDIRTIRIDIIKP